MFSSVRYIKSIVAIGSSKLYLFFEAFGFPIAVEAIAFLPSTPAVS